MGLIVLFGYISLICSNGCVSAQNTSGTNAKQGKFRDKDIVNFIPTFSPDMSGLPKAETRNANVKLPESNSSERVRQVLDSVYESNKKIKYMEGFRILVYSGDIKNEADRAKENVYRLIPDADIYALYKQPDYRVKVGDFTDRLEARRILEKNIKGTFPNAIVIPDNILIKGK